MYIVYYNLSFIVNKKLFILIYKKKEKKNNILIF